MFLKSSHPIVQYITLLLTDAFYSLSIVTLRADKLFNFHASYMLGKDYFTVCIKVKILYAYPGQYILYSQLLVSQDSTNSINGI